jgi:hypothetical protein
MTANRELVREVAHGRAACGTAEDQPRQVLVRKARAAAEVRELVALRAEPDDIRIGESDSEE